jgi:hypothetical protein
VAKSPSNAASESPQDAPRILVLTAYSGEPQFERQNALLAVQRGVTIHHQVIEGRAKREAHALMRSAAATAEGYDWVLKLDGDMVPTSDRSLRVMATEAQQRALSRITYTVWDWFTCSHINGVHIFRPGAVETTTEIDALHTDNWIGAIPGITVKRNPPVVLHSPDPSPNQSLRFGLQRGLKARREGARSNHWRTISLVGRHARRSRAEGAALAAAGITIGLGLVDRWDPTETWLDLGSNEFRALGKHFAERPDVVLACAALVASRSAWWQIPHRLFERPADRYAYWRMLVVPALLDQLPMARRLNDLRRL